MEKNEHWLPCHNSVMWVMAAILCHWHMDFWASWLRGGRAELEQL